jgi:membrane associated rhomboid family serine protease
MVQSILPDLLTFPAATLIAFFCIVFWIYIKHKGWTPETFAIQYHRIMENKEYWRIFSGSLGHHHLLHLIFNITGFWSCRELEPTRGTVFFLKIVWLLILGSAVLFLVFTAVIVRCGHDDYRYFYAYGFSGVVFGLMTFVTQLSPTVDWVLVPILEVHLPMNLAPYGALLITHLFIPQASFLGHVSGILTGHLLALLVHYFADRWFPTPLFYILVFICLGFVLASTRPEVNAQKLRSFLQLHRWNFSASAYTFL